MEIFQERQQVLQFGLLPPHQSYLGLYHHPEILKYYHLDHEHPCFFRISLLSKKKNKRKSLWNTSTFGSPSWTSTTKADWIERVSKLAYFRALSIVSGKCRTPGKILLLLCIFIDGSVQKGIQTIQTTSASTRPVRSDRFYSTCWRTL